MKVKVHAHIEPTELQLTQKPPRGISGTLFLQIDEAFFPAEHWGDYVVPVLGWWAENAMRLYQPDVEVKNIVMDGSYIFTCRREPANSDIIMRFYDNGCDLIGEHKVSYARYLAALRGATKSVLQEVDARGLAGGPDTEALRTRLQHIQKLEADIKARGLP